MLALFRTNQLLAGILILGYAALLRISWFWQTVPVLEPTPGVGNSWLVPLLNSDPMLLYAVPLLLLFFQALLANGIVFAHRMAATVNLFPGVFVVLVGSLLPSFLPYSGFVVANMFLLLSFRALLKCFRANSAADTIFNAGFWLGMATLFVPAYLVFIPAISVTLTLLKSGKFRDQAILLLGAFLPLYLVGIYYYWNDSLDAFWILQWTGAFALPQIFSFQSLLRPDFLVMLTLLLFVIFNQHNYFMKTKMDVQIKTGTLFWLLAGAGLSALWIMPWQIENWQIVVPMIGILLALSFTKAKRATAETWHLVLLVVLVLLHFSFLFKF